jgi:hypothetical protein
MSDLPSNDLVGATYQPLIYTVVYGPTLNFECLRLFIESLIEFGCYHGDLMIFSDRAEEDVVGYLPAAIRDKTHFKTIDNASLLSRYQTKASDVSGFSPILYMDVDIIVDKNINKLLAAISGEDRVFVSTERRYYPDLCSTTIANVQDVRRFGKWFGLELLRSDEDCANDILPIANSGIFGYVNHATFSGVARLVESMYKSESHSDLIKHFTDQPLLNYVLVKTHLGKYEPLSEACEYSGVWQEFPLNPRGFLHFIWAKGEDKYHRMQAYMLHLRSSRKTNIPLLDGQVEALMHDLRINLRSRIEKLEAVFAPKGQLFVIGPYYDGDAPSFEEWEAAERVRCGAGPHDKVISLRIRFV